MSIFTSKPKNKEITTEQKLRLKAIIKEVKEIEVLMKKTPEKTKELGDLVLRIIKLKEEQYKITSTMSDRMGLRTLKILYKSGRGYGKWK